MHIPLPVQLESANHAIPSEIDMPIVSPVVKWSSLALVTPLAMMSAGCQQSDSEKPAAAAEI